MILRWNIEVLEISNPVAQGKARWGVIRLDQPRKNCNELAWMPGPSRLPVAMPSMLPSCSCVWANMEQHISHQRALIFQKKLSFAHFRCVKLHLGVIHQLSGFHPLKYPASQSCQVSKHCSEITVSVIIEGMPWLKSLHIKIICINYSKMTRIQKTHSHKMIKKTNDFRTYKPQPQVFKRQDALCNLGLVEHLVNLEGHQPTTNADAPPVSGQRFVGGDLTSWCWI